LGNFFGGGAHIRQKHASTKANSTPIPSKPPTTPIKTPTTEDPWLPQPYDADSCEAGKAAARAELRKRLNLAWNDDRPIVAVVSRLTGQKGVPLIKHAAWRTLDRGGQFVLLGSAPDPRVQGEFNALAGQLSGGWDNNAAFCFFYDEPLSHLIYAAADIVLVPSMFEPCGLTQMIAMRYGGGAFDGGFFVFMCVCFVLLWGGCCPCFVLVFFLPTPYSLASLKPPKTNNKKHTVPVVRHTGGLRDTVFDVDNDRARAAWEVAGSTDADADGPSCVNGFAFEGADAGGLDYALNRAMDAYYNDRAWFRGLQGRVMRMDWSWNKPALQYVDLMYAAINK
jgi:starch synthase